MQPSQAAIDLIHSFEGLRLNAYRDSEGIPTIGWGTTQYRTAGLARFGRTKVLMGDYITREDADAEFEAFLQIITSRIKATGAKLNQNQFDAAASFCYNAGFPSPQMKRLKEGKLDEFAKFMLLYINKGTSSEAGLRRRREAELALWRKGDTSVSIKPTWINLVRHTVKEAPEYRAYLMDGGNCLEIKRFKTRQELIEILTDAPSVGNVAVGTEGWHVEPGPTIPESEPEKPKPQPSPSLATLKRTGRKEPQGCEELLLTIGDQEFSVRSGQPYAQVFEKGSPSNMPGSMRPLPSGDWTIGPIEFAGGKDNYQTNFAPNLGPVWVGLEPKFATRRSAIGAHLDLGAYGTAGCVGLRNIDDLKRFVAALRKHDPKTLKVDWS